MQAELEQNDREQAMRKENAHKARLQREVDAKAARRYVHRKLLKGNDAHNCNVVSLHHIFPVINNFFLKTYRLDNLRAPISVIMGYVDTGKTSLLVKIRHTNVQEGEAGGITQQIDVTQFAKETLAAQTMCLQQASPFQINIPGLLVIDTPGHESFTNLFIIV